jgi:hypothetical protein
MNGDSKRKQFDRLETKVAEAYPSPGSTGFDSDTGYQGQYKAAQCKNPENPAELLPY